MAKRLKKNRKKKNLVLIIFLVLFVMIGIGYSALSTQLNIGGSLEVSEYIDPNGFYLYNVLKDEAESNGVAREYTGAHNDSFVKTGNKKIYHWYASNNTQVSSIIDKDNVIFADYCWRMIRTTDTGGVKLIYNGVAENNQCLDTRGSHVGYSSRSTLNLSSSYWYGTQYIYNSNDNLFQLSGGTVQATWNATTYPDLIGKYTCRSTGEDGTCSTLYFIENYYSSSSARVISITPTGASYSAIGSLPYSDNRNPSGVGYMYNSSYSSSQKVFAASRSDLNSQYITTAVWFAHDITWNGSSYSLVDPYQVSSSSDFPNLVGEYTFRNNNNHTYVFYIVGIIDDIMYYYALSSGKFADELNYIYTYGDSYTDNGNGTYTINNPSSFDRKSFLTNGSNITHKYLCIDATNNTCGDLKYIVSGGYYYTYLNVPDNYKYANSFTYENGVYHLSGDTVGFWNVDESSNYSQLGNHHYTCWNTTGECTTIAYVYNIILGGDTNYGYFELTGGKSIDDIKNEMFYVDDVNTTNSVAKIAVEGWYGEYLIDYDSYIEDTIYCNDRSQNNAATNGWNPNGGSTEMLKFKGADGLSCPNVTDQFSISNNKARLKYKVGLVTYPELLLPYYTSVGAAGQDYWTMSPDCFYSDNDPYVQTVYSTGGMSSSYANRVYISKGVRPTISLRSGIQYLSGDGSKANPYIVDTN